MDLSEKLTEIESQRSALLAYANGVTGESDTRLGDAVRTLADGFGSGSVAGGFPILAEKRFSLDKDSTSSKQVNKIENITISRGDNFIGGAYNKYDAFTCPDSFVISLEKVDKDYDSESKFVIEKAFTVCGMNTNYFQSTTAKKATIKNTQNDSIVYGSSFGLEIVAYITSVSGEDVTFYINVTTYGDGTSQALSRWLSGEYSLKIYNILL